MAQAKISIAETIALADAWQMLPYPRPNQVRYWNLYARIRDDKPVALIRPNFDLVPQIQREMGLPPIPIHEIGRDLDTLLEQLQLVVSTSEFTRESISLRLRVTASDMKALLLDGKVEYLLNRKWRIK